MKDIVELLMGMEKLVSEFYFKVGGTISDNRKPSSMNML